MRGYHETGRILLTENSDLLRSFTFLFVRHTRSVSSIFRVLIWQIAATVRAANRLCGICYRSSSAKLRDNRRNAAKQNALPIALLSIVVIFLFLFIFFCSSLFYLNRYLAAATRMHLRFSITRECHSFKCHCYNIFSRTN